MLFRATNENTCILSFNFFHLGFIQAMRKGYYLRIIILLVFSLSITISGWTQDEEIVDDSLVKEEVFSFGQKAYYYFDTIINLDSAEYYFKKAIDLAHNSGKYKINYRVAYNENTLASLYRKIHDLREALAHYNEAERIFKETAPDHKYLGAIYHNKGNIYRIQNDVFKAKEYYEYALDFFTKHGYQNDYEFAFVYANYLDLLFILGEYDLAEEKLSTIELNKFDVTPLIEFRIQNTNASLYSNLGKYELAEEQFNRLKRNIEIQPGLIEYTNDILIFYYNLIDFHISYEKYDLALEDCNNALIFIESLDPITTRSKIIYRSDVA